MMRCNTIILSNGHVYQLIKTVGADKIEMPFGVKTVILLHILILLSFMLSPLSFALCLQLSTIVLRDLVRILTLIFSFGLGTVSNKVARTSTVEAMVCVARTSGRVVM